MTIVLSQQQQQSPGTSKNNHRIYIGGLDPSRLTVEEVLQRIQDQQIQIHDVHTSSQVSSQSYVQFTAIQTNNNQNATSMKESMDKEEVEEDETKKNDVNTTTAFNKIHQLFNNVKWKGCKLKVEYAKPNFLVRLRDEIRERECLRQKTESRNSSLSSEPTNSNTATVTTPPSVNNKGMLEPSSNIRLRRHLRIKRAYGQTSWQVDTKPYHVTNFHDFQKVHTMLKLKREKFEATKIQLKQQQKQQHQQMKKGIDKTENMITPPKEDDHHKAHFYRCIHLRFDETFDSTVVHTQNNHDVDTYESDDIDSDTSSSSNESGIEVGSIHSTVDPKTLHDKEKDEYAWSDSDNDTSSSGSLNGREKKIKTTTTINAAVDVEYQQKSAVSLHGFIVERGHQSVNEEKVYLKNNNGGDDESDEEMMNDFDIEYDMDQNMSVLRQIYPELAQSSKDHQTQNNNNKLQKKNEHANGWTSDGVVMLRYDPKKQQVPKSDTIIENSIDDDQIKDNNISNNPVELDGEAEFINKDDEEEEETSSSLQVHETVEENLLVKKEVPDYVYEQDQLEEVFRQARDGPVDMNVFDQAQHNQIESTTPPSLFSFGFVIPDTGTNTLPVSIVDQQGEDSIMKDDDKEGDHIMDENMNDSIMEIKKRQIDEEHEIGVSSYVSEVKKLRRSFYDFVPTKNDNTIEVVQVPVMNELVKFAYECSLPSGDGIKILNDIDTYRSDPLMMESWKNQRKVLTDDWKQKKKLAGTKKKKQQQQQGYGGNKKNEHHKR